MTDENTVTSTDVFAQVATVTSRQAEALTCVKPYLEFDLQQAKSSLFCPIALKTITYTLQIYFNFLCAPEFLHYFIFNSYKNKLN